MTGRPVRSLARNRGRCDVLAPPPAPYRGRVRSRLLIVAVLVLAVVAGACGGDDDLEQLDGGGGSPPSTTAPASTPGDVAPGTTARSSTSTSTTSTTVRPTTTTAAPSTTTTLPPTTTTTAPPEPRFEPGETSPEIGLLQVRLTELGYRPGEPNGVYGPQTTSAVMAFQKREGLGRDGIAGPQTMARLAAPQGAGPRRSGPGPWVEVDIARQVVFVADPGGAVFTLNTSTGSGQPYRSGGTTAIARTPRGSFAVYRTVNALERGPLGTLYRPMYFTGGYALHGSPSVPAYPASHGCVRLSNADTDWLWGFAGKGTPVDLYG